MQANIVLTTCTTRPTMWWVHGSTTTCPARRSTRGTPEPRVPSSAENSTDITRRRSAQTIWATSARDRLKTSVIIRTDGCPTLAVRTATNIWNTSQGDIRLNLAWTKTTHNLIAAPLLPWNVATIKYCGAGPPPENCRGPAGMLEPAQSSTALNDCSLAPEWRMMAWHLIPLLWKTVGWSVFGLTNPT